MKNKLPFWKGFNLLELFTEHSKGDFREDDFKWISEWGFNFVRIPMNYKTWASENDLYNVKEEIIEKIDNVVYWGQKYNIHVNLNIHHAPGYCVNAKLNPSFNLWKTGEALNAFIFYWQMFAKRYKDIDNKYISFNLINEPRDPSDEEMTRKDYENVIRKTVEKIRQISPDRLIMIDGLSYGNVPMPELIDTGVAQSCRGYLPFGVSHFKAEWVHLKLDWKTPTWPFFDGNIEWNKDTLYNHYKKWAELIENGIGVICGEGGAYCHTPHDVVLAWLNDLFDVLKEFNIGFALWNFRGTFGILDSQRQDVDYVDFYGHKLDKKMLDLFRSF
ncbi:glycoside hydrolase family 5 protein [Caldicellulosiruptoraceae bacterium PP1]